MDELRGLEHKTLRAGVGHLGAHWDDVVVGVADGRLAVVHVGGRQPVGPGVRAGPGVVGEPPRAGAVDGDAPGGGVVGVVVAPVVADGVVGEVEGSLEDFTYIVN